jgi:hypothetical protein
MARLAPIALLGALLLALAAAPAAHADAFDRIFGDYQRDGRIDPCRYSEDELRDAKGQVPNDIEAYAPDFPDALAAAAEQRAGGGCPKRPGSSGGAAGAAGAGGGAAPPGAAPPAAPGAPPDAPGAAGTPAPEPELKPAAPVADDAIAQAAASSGDSEAGTPAALLLLAILGALLALGGALYALARWSAWDPAWARGTRHAVGEAGWRASATWAEFADWVRIGR